MGIIEGFKNYRRRRIIEKARAYGLTVPDSPRLKNARFLRWLRGDYTLQNSELLFSAVSRIANAFSSMPVQLYKGSAPVYNKLGDLLQMAPNPNMTACQFFRALEACRCTCGNAYALKLYGEDGTVERLDILDPSRVTPVLSEDTGELWYRVTPEKGSELYIHGFYIVHVPFISTNGYMGVNPVSVLYDTLSYSEKIQSFSTSQLEQGVNASVVIEAPANLGQAQLERMYNTFMELYSSTGGNLLFLESGVTAKTLNLSPVDTKLFEVEKITRSKVAMVYNLPPHLLGDYSDTSFSSQEQQMLEFMMLTMLPIVTAYEQELNMKLLTRLQRKKGYHFKFNMDSILRADAATQAEVDYKAVRSAWKTPDEIRAAHNLPPYPGGIGKAPMISQDLATLEFTVRQKAQVLAGLPIDEGQLPRGEN